MGESQGCFRKNKEQGVEVNESQITGFVCANTVWPESLSKPLAWPELKVERCQGGGRGVSKQAVADLHFRRVPGWIAEKRSEVCRIQQKTGEEVLKLDGWT